jgi:hypothetical protein
MVTENKIGFVGGCAITQPNIPKEKRFIEIFKIKMKSNYFIEPSFLFSSYSQCYQLENIVKKIMDKQKIEILVLHIRPQPFLRLSKLIIKDITTENRVSFFINPLLFKKTEYQNIENNPPQIFNQLVLKPKFMAVNIFFGKLFRINMKASKLIFSTISKIHSECVKNNIQFIVLGITPQPMTKQGNSICKKFNTFLTRKCFAEKIYYCDSFSKMDCEECFLSDKLHLSEKGHSYLGSILFDGVKHFTIQNKTH